MISSFLVKLDLPDQSYFKAFLISVFKASVHFAHVRASFCTRTDRLAKELFRISSVFFVSLEDDLMRLFSSDRIAGVILQR